MVRLLIYTKLHTGAKGFPIVMVKLVIIHSGGMNGVGAKATMLFLTFSLLVILEMEHASAHFQKG